MDTAGRTRDEWLALRCQAGEGGAFEDLLATMERPLLYYATKLLRDEETALDVLQDVWLRVFRNIRRLKDPGSLRPWLYRLTHGIAVDRIRGSSSRERAEEALAGQLSAVEPSFTAHEADAIHAALDELVLMHREVLTLHFLEDFTIAEIAVVVDCPEGTVKSRIYHAKKAMKEILLRGGYGTE
ncbi:MAG TPA: sigma-70 family RNA polymerase sigma factor [Bryobacteraceae bacterium]|jgi:RNA polymerase sigma-70 factor (ECF subfamily)